MDRKATTNTTVRSSEDNHRHPFAKEPEMSETKFLFSIFKKANKIGVKFSLLSRSIHSARVQFKPGHCSGVPLLGWKRPLDYTRSKPDFAVSTERGGGENYLNCIFEVITFNFIRFHQDVAWLASKLPNLKASIRVDYPLFNHWDFLWSVNVNELLYNRLVSLLPAPFYVLPKDPLKTPTVKTPIVANRKPETTTPSNITSRSYSPHLG